MHILFIPAWWPTLHDPTAGVFIQKQAVAVANRGHQVGVAYFQNQLIDPLFNEKSGDFIEKKDGVDVFRRLGFWFLPKKNDWALRQWMALYDPIFEKYCQLFGIPDLIHAQGYQSVFVADRLSEKHQIPFVFTEQATVFRQKKVAKWLWKPLRKSWSNAEKVIALTPALRDSMHEIWPTGRIEILPNLLLESDWPPFFINKKEKKQPFTFISVCALQQKKGLDILIKAFEKCCERSERPLRLVIVGDGPDRRKVAFWAKRSIFSKNIELSGVLTGRFLAQELANADSFVLASRHETFGVVVIEAMACGLPVVATRCGGPEFIVEEVSGILVPPENVDAFATAMLEMIAGHEKFDPEKISSSALARFSEKIIGKKLEDIYQSILSKNKKTANRG